MVSTDQELLTNFAVTRDERSFVALVRRYERLVRSVCRRVLRDEHLAEDAFQSSFLVLAEQACLLSRWNRPLAPWLQTVATNAALQLRRTRRRAQRRDQEFDGSVNDSALNDLVGLLDEELQSLENDLREVIVLCCLEGKTQDETAQQIGVSKSTVRRRMESGLALLRSRFRRHGLLMPAFAVFVNAVRSSHASPSDVHQVSDLVELVRQLPEVGSVSSLEFPDLDDSCQLLQKGPTMSRWIRPDFWIATGLSTVAMISVGVWPLISPTEAREKPDRAEPKRAAIANPQRLESKTAEVKSRKPVPATAKPDPELNDEVAEAADALDAIPEKELPNGNVPTAVNSSVTVKTAKAQSTQSNKAFNGVININGKEFRTNDAAEFQKLMQQNQGLFPQLPLGANGGVAGGGGAAAAGGGANAGAAAGGGANGAFNGVININGKEFRTNDAAEFQKLMQQNQGLFPQLPLGVNGGLAGGGGGANAGAAAGGGANGAFNGVININGKEFRTNDAAEFQKLMQQNQGLFPQLPLGANGGLAGGGGAAAAIGAQENPVQNGLQGKPKSTNKPKESSKGRKSRATVPPNSN